MIKPVASMLFEEIEPKLVVIEEKPKIVNMRVNTSIFFGLLSVKFRSLPPSVWCLAI